MQTFNLGGSPRGGGGSNPAVPAVCVCRSENKISYRASSQSHTHYSSAVNAEAWRRRRPVGRRRQHLLLVYLGGRGRFTVFVQTFAEKENGFICSGGGGFFYTET